MSRKRDELCCSRDMSRFSIEFMVAVDAFPSSPLPVGSDDVDVVDFRLSQFWIFGGAKNDNYSGIISFPEWANEESFFQNLIEGGEASEVWQKYREVLEMEYADSNLSNSAERLSDGWVQCFSCLNAWRPDLRLENIKCPSCSRNQLNPLIRT